MSNAHRTFLSNHAHVLICIVRNPSSRVRDIADRVGITERAVMRIIGELEEAGYIDHERVGRRNHYTINLDATLRHPLERNSSVRELLQHLVDNNQMVSTSKSK